MMHDTDGYKVEPVKITADRRWLAARRLAAGDDLHLAAARAGLHEDQVAWLQNSDPGFGQLIEAARHVQQLDGANRRAAEVSMALAALEDQLSAGNASVLNNALKAIGHFNKDEAPEELPVVAQNAILMSALSDEELAEYLWISARNGVAPEDRHDMPFTPPENFGERIKVLTSQLQHATISCEQPVNDNSPPQEGRTNGDDCA